MRGKRSAWPLVCKSFFWMMSSDLDDDGRFDHDALAPLQRKIHARSGIFDGTGFFPRDMGDVSSYPLLLETLRRRA